jgi:hypothetical protein
VGAILTSFVECAHARAFELIEQTNKQLGGYASITGGPVTRHDFQSEVFRQRIEVVAVQGSEDTPGHFDRTKFSVSHSGAWIDAGDLAIEERQIEI